MKTFKAVLHLRFIYLHRFLGLLRFLLVTKWEMSIYKIHPGLLLEGWVHIIFFIRRPLRERARQGAMEFL